MNYMRVNWVPLLVILIGFCASLALALAPFNFLLANTVPDDSFYYFQIARNIVHGLGSTFDGINMTNGYHPLWMLILVPIFSYFSTAVVVDVAPIHAALVLSAALNAALGFVLLAIVSRYTSNMWIKSLALLCWFFNPFNLYSMSDGLETALSMFLIASFFLSALHFRDRKTHMSLLIVGVIGGLMMLARLDNVFYFVMFLAWLIYENGLYHGIRRVLLAGIVATVVVAPWLLLNYLYFGMFFTSASAAYTIVNHRIIYQDNGYSLFQQLKAVVFMTDYTLRHYVLPRTGAPFVFITLFGITVGWLLYTEGRIRQLIRSIPLEIFIGAGFALVFIANASIRWSPREWYFVAFNLFLAIWIAWFLEKLRERDMLRAGVVLVGACLVLSLYYISWSKYLRDAYYTSYPIFVSTLWVNDNIPDDSIIGAFNAGIVGYFSTHRVINLDGLVNNRAYEAIRDRRVWDYIQFENIGYMHDNGAHINYRMKSSLGIPSILEHLEVVHETVQGPTVYKIR
ncbi:MAG: hypothetical protein Q8R25_00800 [bacterium]|nr:hypothetical protein [bacterium]